VKRSYFITLAAVIALASPAFADKTQVFSVRPEEGTFCESDLQAEVKKVKGIKKFNFDKTKLQLAVTSANGLPDQVVLDAIKRARARCSSNADMATMVAPENYSKDADVVLLSKKGESIGSLKKHLVPGKYTVFDVYADWCGPCRTVDERLRDLVGKRADVAVRKLNVVDFESPLGKELGSRLEALPYLIVFTPSGKRIDIAGADMDKLDKALTAK